MKIDGRQTNRTKQRWAERRANVAQMYRDHGAMFTAKRFRISVVRVYQIVAREARP